MIDAYACITPFYDLEFADFDADVGLYLGYAGIVGSPILELGCGTGRLLAPLVSAGYEVVGLDNSPSMVERARERLASVTGDTAHVSVGDMTQLAGFPEGHFKLVFSAINSFLHLESQGEQLAALRGVRRLLHDDGILVLDLFHPTPTVLQGMDEQTRLDGHWDLPDGGRLDRLSHRRLHLAEQVIDTTLYYDRIEPSGALTRTVATYSMRYIHRFEMEALLAQAGFEMEGVYGSYQLDPLEDGSAVMIFVAHRQRSRDSLL